MVKVLKKIIKYVIAPIILLLSLTLSLLFFPSIQKRIIKRVEVLFNKNTNINIVLDDIKISPFGFVDIKGVLLRDHRSDTIFFVKNIRSFIYPHSIIFGVTSFAYLDLDTGFIRIKKHDGDIKTNLDILIENFDKDNNAKSNSDSNLDFHGTVVSISNFSFYDLSRDIKLDNLEILLSRLNLKRESCSFNLQKIDINSQGYSNIKTKGEFSIDREELKIKNFNIEKGESEVEIDLEISTKNKMDVRKLIFNANLNFEDFKEYKKLGIKESQEKITVRINKKIKSEEADIYFSNKKNILFEGKAFFDGENIDLAIKEFSGNFTQVENLVNIFNPIKIPNSFNRENLFLLNGSIKKIGDSVFTNIFYNTSKDGNIVIKAKNDINFKKYKFEIKTTDLNLSKIYNNGELGILNSKIIFHKNEDTLISNFDINEVNYGNLKYKNIHGNFKNYEKDISFFVFSKDENIDVNLYINSFKNKYENQLDINLNLNKIIVPLDEEKLELSMSVNGNLKYKNQEFGNLNLNFQNIVYNFRNERENLENMIVEINERENNFKYIKVRSKNIANITSEGNFKYADINKIISLGFNKYLLNKNQEAENTNINFSIDINKKFLEKLGVKISKNLTLNTKIISKENIVQLSMNKIESISYLNYNLNNVEFRLTENNLENKLIFKSENIKTPYLNLNELEVSFYPNEKKEKIFLEILAKNEFDKISRLDLDYSRKEKDIVFNIKKSIFRLGYDEELFMNEKNKKVEIKINIEEKKIEIDSLIIGKNNKFIVLNGKMEDQKGAINLNVEGIRLDYTYQEDTLFKIQGDIRSDFSFKLNKLKIKPSGTIEINNFKLSGDKYGKVLLKISEEKEGLYLDLSITKDEKIIFSSNGNLNLDKGINLDLKFSDFNIYFLSALRGTGLTNIRGFLSGDGNFIFNSLNDLYITGDYRLKKSGLGIGYLNIDKDLSEEEYFSMNKEGFILKKMKLYENGKKVGDVNGTITHDDFKLNSWHVNLDVNSYGAKVFDQKKMNPEGLKGEIYADGICNIKGYIMRGIDYTIKAKSLENSYCDIGVSEINKNQNKVILFKDDEVKKINKEDKTISKYSFELEVDDKTNIQISLEDQKGTIIKMSDRISLYGRGKIEIKAITSGTLELYGRYDIDRGYCFLNLENIIEKKLEILGGSFIQSEGNIKQGQINIKSRHKTKLNISNYITISDNSRYETWLDLYISNNISNPQFNFDIKIPYSSQEIQNELSYRLNEGNERENQFFSILSLGSFSTNKSSELLNGDYLIGSLLSSQISNIANRISNDVDINFNYSRNNNNLDNINQQSINSSRQLEVGVSKKIFSDRILISGAVGVPIAESQSNSNNSLSMDIQIEANISDDNKWKAKIFNKQEPSVIQQGDNNFSQGVGISYKSEFNSFLEFIKDTFMFWKKKEDE